jgi:riboflavin kinase/FMN adenylyltransferase
MKTFQSLVELRSEPGPVLLAAGFFDGVHRGHAKVIDTAMRKARERGGSTWVLTFDTHPMRVLNPPAAPLLLTCNRHRKRLLGRLRVDGCLLLPFTRELAEREPESFVSDLHACIPPLTEVIVGSNWRFGHAGRGGPAMLSRLSRGRPLSLTVVRPVVWQGETISSTRIRQTVMRGNLGEAEAMLGRPFSVLGTVTHGRAIGRQLGFPTANLDSNNEVLPPLGVYAVVALIGDTLHRGVINLGVRPTFGGQAGSVPLLELHVFDVDSDLYGQDVEVFFAAHLRAEMKFASHADLADQIARDVRAAREALAVSDIPKKLEDYLYSAERTVI